MPRRMYEHAGTCLLTGTCALGHLAWPAMSFLIRSARVCQSVSCCCVVLLLLCRTAVVTASSRTAAGRTNCTLRTDLPQPSGCLPMLCGAPRILLPLTRDGYCVGHHATRPPSAAQRRCAARRNVRVAACRIKRPSLLHCSSPLVGAVAARHAADSPSVGADPWWALLLPCSSPLVGAVAALQLALGGRCCCSPCCSSPSVGAVAARRSPSVGTVGAVAARRALMTAAAILPMAHAAGCDMSHLSSGASGAESIDSSRSQHCSSICCPMADFRLHQTGVSPGVSPSSALNP